MTGWLLTDIRENVGCPACGVKAGESCITPSGRKSQAMGGHSERSVEFRRLYPDYVHGQVVILRKEDIV